MKNPLIAFCLLSAATSAGLLRAAEVFTVVAEGSAAPVYLPSTTETERFVAMDDAQAREMQRARFPKATDAELDDIVARYREWRKWEASRAGDDERLAAEELRDYLGKIAGAAPAVTNAAALPPAPAVCIGSELARVAGLGAELDALEPDGFLVAVKDGRLHLAGRRARGTLYAVYGFLEGLGVRWFMPGKDGEFVPKLDKVVAEGTRSENPTHRVRYWWCTYGNGAEYPRWTLRNKGNFIRALGDPEIAQGHHLASGIQSAPNQSPDYYAMKDGQPNGMIPNMSNPKVWDIYADFYKRELKGNPFGQYASISAEDALMNDERPESRLLESNEFDPFMGSFSATDRLWFFHRRYIDKVLEELPGRRFGVLVYSNNLTPPRIETVHPAMALVMAPLGISPLFPVGDPRSRDNVAYKGWLESWLGQAQAVGAESYYYDYEPLGFSWNKAMICPRWSIIGQNYRYFHQLGLTGHTTQGWDDWGSCALDHWMMIRMYWNAEQDWRDIVADYCSRRFLEAGDAMRAYYAVYERRMAEIPELCGNEIWGDHLVLTPEVRAAARAELAKAESAANSEFAKRQVAIARELQDSTDFFCDGIELARETGDFAAAAQLFEKSFAIIDKSHERYSHAMNPRAGKAGDIIYEPGGWYNKYLAWDKRIKSAAVSLRLPRMWKTCLDTDNLASTRDRLHLPETDASALDDWDITVVPDVKYQTQKQVSAVFMRVECDVPGAFEGKGVKLYFPSLIARALQIWVNGVPVTFDHGNYTDTVWRGPSYFWFDYNHQHEYDLGDLVRPGERNTIAIRIFKSFDHAGSYDRVFLLGDAK